MKHLLSCLLLSLCVLGCAKLPTENVAEKAKATIATAKQQNTETLSSVREAGSALAVKNYPAATQAVSRAEKSATATDKTLDTAADQVTEAAKNFDQVKEANDDLVAENTKMRESFLSPIQKKMIFFGVLGTVAVLVLWFFAPGPIKAVFEIVVGLFRRKK